MLFVYRFIAFIWVLLVLVSEYLLYCMILFQHLCFCFQRVQYGITSLSMVWFYHLLYGDLIHMLVILAYNSYHMRVHIFSLLVVDLTVAMFHKYLHVLMAVSYFNHFSCDVILRQCYCSMSCWALTYFNLRRGMVQLVKQMADSYSETIFEKGFKKMNISY